MLIFPRIEVAHVALGFLLRVLLLYQFIAMITSSTVTEKGELKKKKTASEIRKLMAWCSQLGHVLLPLDILISSHKTSNKYCLNVRQRKDTS